VRQRCPAIICLRDAGAAVARWSATWLAPAAPAVRRRRARRRRARRRRAQRQQVWRRQPWRRRARRRRQPHNAATAIMLLLCPMFQPRFAEIDSCSILRAVFVLFSHRAPARLQHCGLHCGTLNNASAAAVRASCCPAVAHGPPAARTAVCSCSKTCSPVWPAARLCARSPRVRCQTRCCCVLHQRCMLAHGWAANTRCCCVLPRCMLADGRAADTTDARSRRRAARGVHVENSTARVRTAFAAISRMPRHANFIRHTQQMMASVQPPSA
jgi:hypothetical protein